MSIKEMLAQAAGFDSATIAKLLDATYREAHNANLSFAATKSHLVTAAHSPDRVKQELNSIEERIKKELRTHESSMKQLDALKQQWLLSPDEARAQVSEARSKAVEAAKTFQTVKLVAEMNRVACSVDLNSNEFDELLGAADGTTP